MKKVDERISIAKRGEPLDVELVVGGAKTSYQQIPSLSGTFVNRSSATASGAAGLIASGLTATGSNVQASRLSEIDNSDSQELDWVKLRFDEIEDRAAFVAALNALIDPQEFLYEAETHGSSRQSLGERGSLTRKYESSLFDVDYVVLPAEQMSANPELTLLHKAKAGEVNSPESLSRSRRGLAGDSSIPYNGWANLMPLTADSLDFEFQSQQGLAGDFSIHYNGWANLMPLTADSSDFEFWSRRSLVEDSSIDYDGRADIIPSIAGSWNFNLEFQGRNRSSDVLDTDPQRSSYSSFTSNEVGEMRRLRKTFKDTMRKTRTPHIRDPLSPSTKVPHTAHIADITFRITERDIREFLAGCTPTYIRITEDKLEGGSRGSAYATFATLRGLQKALDLCRTLLPDRSIWIGVAALRKYDNN